MKVRLCCDCRIEFKFGTVFATRTSSISIQIFVDSAIPFTGFLMELKTIWDREEFEWAPTIAILFAWATLNDQRATTTTAKNSEGLESDSRQGVAPPQCVHC